MSVYDGFTLSVQVKIQDQVQYQLCSWGLISSKKGETWEQGQCNIGSLVNIKVDSRPDVA